MRWTLYRPHRQNCNWIDRHGKRLEHQQTPSKVKRVLSLFFLSSSFLFPLPCLFSIRNFFSLLFSSFPYFERCNENLKVMRMKQEKTDQCPIKHKRLGQIRCVTLWGVFFLVLCLRFTMWCSFSMSHTHTNTGFFPGNKMFSIDYPKERFWKKMYGKQWEKGREKRVNCLDEWEPAFVNSWAMIILEISMFPKKNLLINIHNLFQI